MAKILLAEDDTNLGTLLTDYLEAKDYRVVHLTDGQKALDTFRTETFDLCLLDIMLPEIDGISLAKKIRKIEKDVPFIFLTAKSLERDKLEGFSVGADDYITKPFSMEELLYRIEAILRRTKSFTDEEADEYKLGKFTFYPRTQILDSDEGLQKLTTKESELLKLLCQNKNEVLERNYALRTIWVDDNYFNARSMDVYITKLRKYLKTDPSITILNIHGKGYRLLCE
ncbi:MAG: response regulator transcription factor [Bacteroidales bacterium]|nr:response regulator transcription factor [Bacteroidales bacterium]